MTLEFVRLRRFGPPGIVEALRVCRWVQFKNTGYIFLPVEINGYILASYPGDGSAWYQISVKDGDRKFSISGFAAVEILDAAQGFTVTGDGRIAIVESTLRLVSNLLSQSSSNINNTLYEVHVVRNVALELAGGLKQV